MREQNNFFMLFLTQTNINKDYTNCIDAKSHNYISKAGADHISAQCDAFIKDEVMVK